MQTVPAMVMSAPALVFGTGMGCGGRGSGDAVVVLAGRGDRDDGPSADGSRMQTR